MGLPSFLMLAVLNVEPSSFLISTDGIKWSCFCAKMQLEKPKTTKRINAAFFIK
jgi:hypothetical protein